ncbi:MAG: hypothetical protein J5916_02365 [Oscillospiraceae bacterium]|nr:hypothetical protein [Clostridia bacterium]MBO5638728.1 hypothetical protein [Oscillospiraceae bacterium]
MKPEREQTEKKNAERYLVVTKNAMPMTVWSESFSDVLGELQQDDIVVRDGEIISITKLDLWEDEE